MAKPTQEEITKEIGTLREQVKIVRKFSSFGDDNCAQIRAQIRVADEDLDNDDIYDKFDSDGEQSAASQMRDWLDYGDDGDGSPSEGWAGLC